MINSYTQYTKEARTNLPKELGHTNPHQVPRIEKVVVSVGVGKLGGDDKRIELVAASIAKITGQKPITTIARKSVAGFKVREGAAVGLTVTLRGARMYQFLDRLINLALPRLRDFQGLSLVAFDGRGTYNLGLAEQTIFPEIAFDEPGGAHGLQINIVTTAKTRAEAEALLRIIGLPLKKEAQ